MSSGASALQPLKPHVPGELFHSPASASSSALRCAFTTEPLLLERVEGHASRGRPPGLSEHCYVVAKAQHDRLLFPLKATGGTVVAGV